MFLQGDGVCTMVFKNSLWNDTGEIKILLENGADKVEMFALGKAI